MAKTLVILGRPNVGKSTLFNRLVRERRAIVAAQPGTTRDRLRGEARLGDLTFVAVDTAGIEPEGEGELAARLRAQSLRALEEGDVALLMVDARTGLTPWDRDLAALLRRQGKPVVVAVNKCEGGAAWAQAQEAWALGLGAPVMISAAHGDGLEELEQALRPYLEDETEEEARGSEEAEPVRLAIVGRPNTGKSSLLNRLVGEERVLVAPVPGVTRDAVDVPWRWRGREVLLVDTAGLRKRGKVAPGLERLATGRTVQSVRRADVVVLVMDATAALERQDVAIATLALRSGKGLVLALNKWDLVDEPQRLLQEVRSRLVHRLGEVRGVPVVPISALFGRNLDRLMEAVFDVYARWSLRIGTGPLNRWLREAVARHPPPASGRHRPKLRYVTQAGARPPRLLVFGNRPAAELPRAYRRYLLQDFQSRFGLEGIPVRLELRAADNPYAP